MKTTWPFLLILLFLAATAGVQAQFNYNIQAMNNNSLIISWVAAQYAGFILQQNPLLGTTNWVLNTNTVTLVNGYDQVIIDPATKNMFYRLAYIGVTVSSTNYVPPTLVVVPSGEQTSVGNAAVPFPWDLTPGTGATSLRYQQVYAASDFGTNSGTISQLGFRVAPAAGNGTAFNPITLSNVTIMISTTAAAVDGLNATFANNTGTNAATVYQGNLTLSSSDVIPSGGNAAAFDTRVYLQTPFNYSPANGNLLLDVKIGTNSPGGIATSYFDGESTAGDSVSRVYATNCTNIAGTADTMGIITQFMFGSTSPGRKPGISWLMTTYNLNSLQSAGNSTVISNNFNNNQTYIETTANSPPTGPSTTSVPSGWNAIGGINFHSITDLVTSISNGWVGFASASANLESLAYGGGTEAVPSEESNASINMPLFANLAHAFGYTFIATPAMDIMSVQVNKCGGATWQEYLNCGEPTTVSPTFPVICATAPADIYQIQAQSLGSGISVSNYSASSYNTLVSGAASQAFRANPKLVVFSGISPDSAGGGQATIDQLYESVADSVTNVSGYWFNTAAGDIEAAEELELLQRLDSINESTNTLVTLGGWIGSSLLYSCTVTIQNTGGASIPYPLQVVFKESDAPLNATNTFGGYPYFTTSTTTGSLGPGGSAQIPNVEFSTKTPTVIIATYSGTF